MSRKTLTFIVIALGIIYCALGANFLHQYREVARVLGTYGISAAEFNSFESIVSLRRTFLSAFIVCSSLGVMTLFIGAGLYFAKEWAERAWLVFTILLPVVHLIRLVAVYELGAFWMIERTIELTLVVAVAVFSWKVLSNPRRKQPLPSPSAT
jgi:predicted transporter